MTPAPPSGRRRRLVRLAAVLLALPLVLVLALWGAINLPPVRDGLAALLASLVSTPDMTVSVGGLDGPLPQSPVLTDVTLSDGEGPWLTIDRLALDWHPLALLAGRVSVDRVAAGRVALARLPAGGEAADDGAPPGIPRLPVALRVADFSVTALDLAAPVLGEAASFAVDGQLAAPLGGRIATRLDVARRDGGAGEAHLRAVLDPDRRALDLELRIAEPAGGLVATLLDLPGRPAVNVALTGDGTAAAWSGHLAAGIDGLVDAEADIGLDAAALLQGGQSLAVTLDGRIRHGFDLGPQAGRLLGDTLAVAADVGFDGEAWRLDVRRLAVSGRAVAATAAGSVGLDDLALDLRAGLRLTEPAVLAELVPDARVAGLAVDADISGTALQPRAAIHAAADGVAAGTIAAGGLVLDATVVAQDSLADSAAAIAIDGSLAATAATGLPPFLGQDLSARLSGTLSLGDLVLDIASLDAGAGPVSAEAAGWIALQTGGADLDLALGVADLGAVSGGQAGGVARLDAGLHGDLYGGDIAVAVDGALSDLRLPGPAQAVVGDRLAFAADVNGRPGGTWAVRELRVDGSGLALAGNATVDPAAEAFGASFGLRLAALDRLSAVAGVDLAGTLDVTGTVAGPFSGPRLTATARLADGRTGPVGWSRLAADVDLAGLPGAPRGTVRLSGDGDYGPLTAAARLEPTEAGGLRLADIAAEGAGLSLAGNLVVPPGGGPVAGRLRADADSLAVAAALAGIDARGAGRVTLDLAARDSAQHVEAAASLRGLALRGAEGPLAALDTVELTAQGLVDPLDLRFTASVAGKQPVALDLDAAGAVQGDGAALALTLERLRGTVVGRALALRRPATLRQGPQGLSLAGLDMTAASGRLTADVSLAPDAVAADVAASDMPVDLLRLAMPGLDIAGRWDARVALSGAPAAPDGSLSLSLSDVGFGDPSLAGLPPLSARLDGRLGAGRLAVEAAIEGLPQTRATASLEIPLQISAQPVAATVPPDGAVSGRLVIDGDIAPVWQLMPIDPHQLAGRVAVDLALAGSVAAPRASGQAALTGGRYENLETGTLLTDLTVQLDGEGTRLRLARASAGDGSGGQLSASGAVAFGGDGGGTVDLAASLANLRLLQRDEILAATSGDLSVDGTFSALRVGGQLVTDLIEIRLTDKLPPQVVTLDVTEIGGNAPAVPAPADAAEEEASALTVTLDLGVDIPRRLFVRGLGLDSEWAGNLKVTGTADAPQVTGALNPVRGQFELAGAAFRLEQGRVGFSGGDSVIPELDLRAVHEGADLRAVIRVSGPATAPRIELSSVPELPQEEILSRVLFGQSAGSLSAAQAVQLADAAASLTGIGGAGGVLERIRQTLGVDVLRLGGDDGGSNVTAGRYIGDRVFVGARQGTTPGSTEATVEIEVLPNLSVETDVGQNARSRVGVKWKWDY